MVGPATAAAHGHTAGTADLKEQSTRKVAAGGEATATFTSHKAGEKSVREYETALETVRSSTVMNAQTPIGSWDSPPT